MTSSSPGVPGRLRIGRFLSLAILIGSVMRPAVPDGLAAGGDVRGFTRLFADPPREYASAPLWVWNDLLTEDEIRGTLRDLAGQGVRQAFVHPRPGLMTPYLGPEWFALWKAALREAARLDMNIWIYDENSYPSGFAGGWVPEVMPEARGLGLSLKETAVRPSLSEDVLAVYRLTDGGTENVTAELRDGGELPAEARYLVARVVQAADSPWHGDRSYVNLLTPGVTEKFLEVTLGAYDREIGEQYGRRVPGVFTDEPNIRPAGGFPWCPDLPEQFARRWGYGLLENLPGLVREVGDWRRVRHNFYSTLNDLFIERWGKPYYEACERRGLEFTGHYWDHEWPHCAGVPDNMAMAAWQHRPGVDTLMNQYAENTHAQFGNVRYCREVSSIANQLARPRTLVEIYGAGGWDLRFEDMKRIADWLLVLGINTMDEHLSYVTVRGARKRDHPQSFSYHEPWWPAYHVHAGYLTRLCAALSQGKQVNRVLVLEPTTTAWMYQGNEAKLGELGDSFFSLLMSLEAAQVEYDLGCEEVIGREGGVGQDAGMRVLWSSAPTLRVGQRQYSVVILPEHTETIAGRTRDLLNQFLLAGGTVLSLSPVPERVDGQAQSDVLASPAAQRGWRVVTRDELVDGLRQLADRGEVVIRRADGDRGILFHHRRELEDGQLLFLVNTSIDHPSRATVRALFGGVKKADPYTGQIEAYPFHETVPGVECEVDLPPSGSLLMLLTRSPGEPGAASPTRTLEMAAASELEIERVGPNVLTLDYVDVTAGGETRRDAYFYDANRFVWQKNGRARNPWDSAVQFRSDLIQEAFPEGSGFQASYRFQIEGPVPPDLAIVVERPDLYSITCNGVSLPAPALERRSTRAAEARIPEGSTGRTVAFEDWWLDRSFARLPIAQCARAGENLVTIQASPMSMWHEIEPAYVLGDFGLRPAPHGWVIVPEAPLRVAVREGAPTQGNQPDGTMWLSAGVGYVEGVEDRAPWVVFDLGKEVALGSVQVWNYSEAHVRDLTQRGAARLRILAGLQPDVRTAYGAQDLGVFRLRRGMGRGDRPDLISLSGSRAARYVRFEILENWTGSTFPLSGDAPDNGFVGLGEVRFLDGEGHPMEGVRVSAKSSELSSHRRTADHLVDGSGLTGGGGLGWNEQGHPFFAEGVAYRQVFRVKDRRGRFVVSLPNWHGAVARVEVNGRPAGWITAPPWECDVTRRVRTGENRVAVTVIGTLRNTLGPHHGGHALGSAWPGMFQKGPESGPPPGDEYSTVAYGLFEPFQMEQRLTE